VQTGVLAVQGLSASVKGKDAAEIANKIVSEYGS